MVEAQHVLISLEEKHAENIFSGKKHVELRRRAMGVPSGTLVWIYVKKPLGAVVGYACVVDCHSFSPAVLWKKFSEVSGLTQQEFFEYFQGVSKGFALELADVQRLHKPVSLGSLRKVAGGFHPPQFFMRLHAEGQVLRALQKANGKAR